MTAVTPVGGDFLLAHSQEVLTSAETLKHLGPPHWEPLPARLTLELLPKTPWGPLCSPHPPELTGTIRISPAEAPRTTRLLSNSHPAGCMAVSPLSQTAPPRRAPLSSNTSPVSAPQGPWPPLPLLPCSGEGSSLPRQGKPGSLRACLTQASPVGPAGNSEGLPTLCERAWGPDPSCLPG